MPHIPVHISEGAKPSEVTKSAKPQAVAPIKLPPPVRIPKAASQKTSK